MSAIGAHTRQLTQRAINLLERIPGLTIHGRAAAEHRSPLVAFSVDGWDPVALADGLNRVGVESRAGCHCATLAHRDLGIVASCRLSFYLYNTMAEVDRAVGAVDDLVSGTIR
jgi:cysteine desulfurase/selenocysteine lyase